MEVEPTNKRFLMLGLFSLAQVTNCAAWINFSAITDKVLETQPQADLFWITYLSMIFLITYIPVNPFAMWVIENKGIRFALILAVFIQAGGLWLRACINYHFMYCVVGQTIISLGQPLIMNMCTKLSAHWFPKKERVVSTMTAQSCAIVGSSIGFLLPFMFVEPKKYKGDHMEMSNGLQTIIRGEIRDMLIFLAGVETLLLLLIIIFFQEKPDAAADSKNDKQVPVEGQEDQASLLQAEQPAITAVGGQGPTVENAGMVEQFKALMKNRNYQLVLWSVSLMISAAITFATVAEIILEPYHYTSENVSLLGFVQQLAGAPGSILAAVVLYHRRSAFKRMTLFAIVGSALTLASFHAAATLMPVSKGFPVAMMSMVLNGFLIAPITSYAFEYAVEVAPEAGESMSSGLIMALSNTIALAEILMIQHQASANPNQQAVVRWAMGVLYLSFVLAYILQNMVELEGEEEKPKEESNDE